ncbi:helix-turn-helix domain-containing protein [Paracoccus sp. JM45]|uniref:helix-turn-helix domain-containing protein n=1 Tax=Paracoccus sp. JM45 TaxID=2283626 RepID=UPI000E6CC725|nr:helix-turn-helix domain-containing protein [Paracoccus sp. JM45]RJE81298.1 hypothetical protein DWB67_01175 [Paracoccus sp. JM45]
MQISESAQKLKALRQAAKMSIREIAFEVGMEKGKYEHYETRFKKPYLPADFADQLAHVLSLRGIARESVMALAGPIEQSVTEDDLHLGARYAKLSPRRQRMMRELLEELEAAEKANLQIAKAADGSPD